MIQADIAFESDNYARIYKLTRMKAYNALNHDMIKNMSSKMKVSQVVALEASFPSCRLHID